MPDVLERWFRGPDGFLLRHARVFVCISTLQILKSNFYAVIKVSISDCEQVVCVMRVCLLETFKE